MGRTMRIKSGQVSTTEYRCDTINTRYTLHDYIAILNSDSDSTFTMLCVRLLRLSRFTNNYRLLKPRSSQFGLSN